MRTSRGLPHDPVVHTAQNVSRWLPVQPHCGLCGHGNLVMIFGSMCSGIEAASVAWNPLGWRAAFFSEMDAFPCAVLKHHHPDVPNHGDMTRFKEWPDHAIDVLAGGTPCQSFSVAGLRKGMADPKGNLALTYLAIAGRYRPRWLVWENVPGVLSSNRGRDFGAFLGGLGQLGYGFAYRVLDAQYVRTRRFPCAVPQRRRRVFVVGYLGNWRPAAAVLFDAESLHYDSTPSGKGKRENTVDAGTSPIIGFQPCATKQLTVGEHVFPTLPARAMAIAYALRGLDGTKRKASLTPMAHPSGASGDNRLPTYDIAKARESENGETVAAAWTVRQIGRASCRERVWL